MDHAVEEITMEPNELGAEEAIELTIDQAMRVIADLRRAGNNYETLIAEKDDKLKKYSEAYNKDMKAVSEVLDNIQARTQKKEDAMVKILEGMQELFLLDRIEIAPKN